MTTTLSAAALRMPHMASVAAPAPLALGVMAEPCAAVPALLPAIGTDGLELGGIIVAAVEGPRGGTDSSDRFGGITRSGFGSWYRQDSAQFAGGGPLRG